MAERQTGKSLSEIRVDHVGRYEWAAKWARGRVLDIACGCGYGANIMAKAGCRVDGVDNSTPTIEYAKANWRQENIIFHRYNALCWPVSPYDWVVCFETLEHLENDVLFLSRLRSMSPNLLISVPNQKAIPFSAKKFPFHVRHYTPEEFVDTLRVTGWNICEIRSQETAYSRDPQPGSSGRTLIARCVGA